jgi:hypothetical protein
MGRTPTLPLDSCYQATAALFSRYQATAGYPHFGQVDCGYKLADAIS